MSDIPFDRNCVANHTGEHYRSFLQRLHAELQPSTYLEIGTLKGETLSIASCRSISIDPEFQISSDAIGLKEECLFYQMTSDNFFDKYDPKAIFGVPVDLMFLDGMHLCEYLLRDFANAERSASKKGLIVLHDCLPVEIPMTDRTQNGTPSIQPYRNGWWTGDLWRTVLALREYRPDLTILCLDSFPTGLVLISNLDCDSDTIKERYTEITDRMLHMDLHEITVSGFLETIGLVSTAKYSDSGALKQAFA